MIVKTQNAKYYFMLVFSFLTNCKILHPLLFIVLIIIILVIIILLLQINQDLMKEFDSCKIFLLFIFSREKAVLAVTLCNDKEEILGHAAFFDYPNIDDVDSATWEDWFHKHYDDPKINSLNSLYMHYFVAKSEYSSGCAKEIIRTAFNAVPDLHYLFLNVPMGTYPGKYR